MISREQFIDCLGPDAEHYKDDQIEQLRIDVRRLAEVLFAMYTAECAEVRARDLNNLRLDDTQADRTIATYN